MCRELSAAYERLLDGFYALTTPELPADLSTRVLDEIKVRPAGRRRAAIVSAILATAAAVAVAVYLPGRQGTDAVPKVAQAEHLALVTKTDPAAAATRQSGANDVAVRWRKLDEVPLVGPMLKSMSDKDKNTDPYEALAKGTGQSLASVVLYMPGIGPNGFISPARSAANSTVWPAQVSEELRPVAESMTETFNLLLRAVPLTFSSSAPRRAS